MKRKWYRLDNAALIFPATMRRSWNNVFRESVTLTEEIDPEILSQAANDIRPRFPTFFVRLRTGFFWYYLEEIRENVRVRPEYAYPLTRMSRLKLRKCCIRILYFENRIAVEFFHSVTDGNGALVFVQNLAARYLELKYRIDIPSELSILKLDEAPKPEEIRDCFPLCSGKNPMSRKEEIAYRLHGELELDGFKHLTTGILPTEDLVRVSHLHHCTVSAFLSAVMACAIQEKQSAERPERRYRPVKITLPVNLRKLYNADTLRNFILTVNIGFNPKDGDYSFDEICAQMSHQIAIEAIPQKMGSRIAANVQPASNPLLRICPLFLKTLVMRMVYADSGERNGCINVSNLGEAKIPEAMMPYVKRFEFIIGVQLSYPNNCSVISYNGRTFINMIRNTKDSELERLFFSKLVELGIPVKIESNERR